MQKKNIRASAATIAKRRRDRTCTILLTGATGFIGSHIARELLLKGYRIVVLARADKQTSAQARIEQLLEWFGMGPMDQARLQVIEAFIDRPCLGLDQGAYDNLANTIDEIIHCASHTSFSERKRHEVERANIEGLRRVLDLAVQGKCYFFHHVSTAYVAGKKSGPCREEFVETAAFTNVYEETKYLGERMLRERCESEGIRLAVYRPSIVYGSSENGRSLRFNALYYPLRTILFLKNLFMKDMREEGGKRAAQMGVTMGDAGSLHLPIRIEAGNGNGLNLVPIDFLVKAFVEIMATSLEGGVFHIVNQRPKTIGELVAYTTRYFNLEGLQAVHTDAFGEKSRNSLETLFDTYVEAYKPYMADARIFKNDKTRSILEKKGITCPDLDYEIFSKCMQYAMETGWGANLFATRHQ
jgi:nucleoside-diphosphate-sugar epimerase